MIHASNKTLIVSAALSLIVSCGEGRLGSHGTHDGGGPGDGVLADAVAPGRVADGQAAQDTGATNGPRSDMTLGADVSVAADAGVASDSAPPGPGTCITGNWTVTNQPGVDCHPYPGALWYKKLPNGGNGGPMNHLIANSAAVVTTMMTAGGTSSSETSYMFSQVNNEGTADNMPPLYYARASDPMFKIISCDRGDYLSNPYYAVGKYVHIPSGATYTGIANGVHGDDSFFHVWDQAGNSFLGVYTSRNFGFTLPACSGTTEATACPLALPGTCELVPYSDKGYQVSTYGGDSLQNGPSALMVRAKEWMNDAIHHAVYLNTGCVNGTVAFPGVWNTYKCTTITNAPSQGALVFVDYTNAQIDAMNVPAWKKALIRVLANYGGYIGDTGGQGAFTGITRFETNEPFTLAGTENPAYAWLQSQGVTPFGSRWPGDSTKHFNLTVLQGIPPLTGPSCPSSPCGVLYHLHVADPCVAKGLAGVPGGCP